MVEMSDGLVRLICDIVRRGYSGVECHPDSPDLSLIRLIADEHGLAVITNANVGLRTIREATAPEDLHHNPLHRRAAVIATANALGVTIPRASMVIRHYNQAGWQLVKLPRRST